MSDLKGLDQDAIEKEVDDFFQKSLTHIARMLIVKHGMNEDHALCFIGMTLYSQSIFMLHSQYKMKPRSTLSLDKLHEMLTKIWHDGEEEKEKVH